MDGVFLVLGRDTQASVARCPTRKVVDARWQLGPCSHRSTVEPWLLPELNSTANEMPSSLPAHCGLTLASFARTARRHPQRLLHTPPPMPRPSFQGGQPLQFLVEEGHGEGRVFPHRRPKECRPASQIQPSIKLDQQNTLSGSPKLIDLVDQSNLFPPPRPRATLGAVRMTRSASALGTGTSTTTPAMDGGATGPGMKSRPSRASSAFDPYDGHHRGSRSRRESSPPPVSAFPWQRQAQRHLPHALRRATRDGRASHTTPLDDVSRLDA